MKHLCHPRAARLTTSIRAIAMIVVLLLGVALGPSPGKARAAVASTPKSTSAAAPSNGEASSLESAASRAGETGRRVAMSLIGLAFAVAAIVLAFRRDFKEAVGVFAVGIVSVLLATPAGVNLLRDTVSSLFGG
jgi:hypothetical protein